MTDTAHATTEAPTREQTMLDINAICRILPHRFPFLLIDRVLDLQPQKSITAIKNVTINEPFFAGHFPNLPIMPGVLIIEAMAQAGGVLLLSEFEDRDERLVLFTGIERAKFRRPVVPGDQLRIEVVVKVWKGTAGRMEGKAYVGEKLAAEANVSCRVVDRSRGKKPSGNGQE